MPLVVQNILILIAVSGCIVYLTRGVVRALSGRKSQIGGCGVCTGCATTSSPSAKTQTNKMAMVSTDSLIRSRRNRVSKN